MKRTWQNRMTVRFRMRRWGNQVLNVLYPDQRNYCLLCQRPVTARAAKEEATALQSVCLFCLQDAMVLDNGMRLRTIPLQTKTGLAPISVVSCRPYQGIVKTALRQWKSDGQLEWTDLFSGWLVTALAANAKQSPNDDRAAVIVPVPTSPSRFQKRGYDHVGLLAGALSVALGIPLVPWLEKVDYAGEFTQSQTAKTARQRRASLRGTIQIAPQPGVDCAGVVLLVDDIVTTGSTLAACTEVLYEAGARRVTAAVIADVE